MRWQRLVTVGEWIVLTAAFSPWMVAHNDYWLPTMKVMGGIFAAAMLAFVAVIFLSMLLPED